MRTDSGVVNALRNARRYLQLASDYTFDALTMCRYSMHRGNDSHQVEAQIMYHAHALEKSLSHDPFEVGHGLANARHLASALLRYQRKDGHRDRTAYRNGLSVLKAYSHAQREDPATARRIDALLDPLAEEINSSQSQIGGAATFTRSATPSREQRTFADVVQSRHSIRQFGADPVDHHALMRALELATRTPSACNRQPARLYVIKSQGIIRSVVAEQGGFRGYTPPPVLLLITADTRSFIASYERNQCFVDGGLFAMSVLYALEAEGLAACALNTMFGWRREARVRRLLGIGSSERLITFVAVGTFREQNHVAKSTRFPLASITKVIG